jgi:transposase
VSGLDDLTREELVALVLKLHETSVSQQAQISDLKAVVERQAERISELEEEVAKLRGSRPGSGIAIKPSVKKQDKQPRKKRSSSFARSTLPATRVVMHAIDECPECHRVLRDGHLKWSRRVIDIPPVKVQVTEHLFLERYCGVCKKRFTPDPLEVLSGVVIGKKSIGIGIMSLLAHLKTVCRVPIHLIRKLLLTFCGLKISSGEIVEILHDIAEIGQSDYEGILSRVRGSPVVHGDETGWREDGVNGYIWSFSTPEVRYYTYRHSRGSIVPREVLSEEFAGALVTDFYAAYNFYEGPKQRCWVHLMRDLEALVEKNPDLPEMAVWVESVMDVYYRAKETTQRECTPLERSRLKVGFEKELLEICGPYVGDKSAPQRVLSQRMTSFIAELFVFVADIRVPSENNAAERAIRPAVVARKISGGTRSSRGSDTSSILRSLFETWNLQGQNTIDACTLMLTSHNSRSVRTSI